MQSESNQTQPTKRPELGSSTNHSAFKIVTTQQINANQIQNNARPTIWKDYITDIVRQRKTLFKKLKQQKELQNLKNQKTVKSSNRRVETNVIIIPPHNSNFFYNNEKLKKIRINEKVKEAKKEKSVSSGSEEVESSCPSSEVSASPPAVIRNRVKNSSRSPMKSTDLPSKKSTSSFKKQSRASRYGRRGKYKMYTEEERITIFKYAEEYGAKKAVQMFGIDRRRIKRWMEKGSCSNIGGQGRSPLNIDMEEKLVKEIQQHCFREGKYPKRKVIKQWALDFYTGDGQFKASKGWFDKFFRRNKDILQELKDCY